MNMGSCRALVATVAACALAVSLSACVTVPEMNAVLRDLNADWKKQNAAMMRENGSRVYQASLDEAYDALSRSVQSLGFTIKESNRANGFVFGVAAAPTPLTMVEWEEVERIDGPPAKAIVAKRLPLSSMFFYLHVDEVDIHVVGAAAPKADGTQVSFEFTMVDHKALNMGLDSNEDPPPTAARVGVEKAWKEFEKQLAIVQKKTA